MPIGSAAAMRFSKVSRSIMRATVMRPASLSTSWKPILSNHSELRRTSVRSRSRIAPACAV